MRIVNQCIAGDTGFLVHRTAEASIYNKQLAIGPDRVLSLYCVNRSMAIYDMRIIIIQSELVQYLTAEALIVIPAIVRIRRLCPHTLVCNVFHLKGLKHSATQRGFFSSPQKPHKVHIILIRIVHIRSPCLLIAFIKQSSSVIKFTINIQLVKGSVAVHRDTAVIEQIAIVYIVHAALIIQKPDMLLQALSCHKLSVQLSHDDSLLII